VPTCFPISPLDLLASELLAESYLLVFLVSPFTAPDTTIGKLHHILLHLLFERGRNDALRSSQPLPKDRLSVAT